MTVGCGGCNPIVLISGFTRQLNEFDAPYRAVNYLTSNSCWNDPKIRFDHKKFRECPRHKDTQRQFESMRSISVVRSRTSSAIFKK